MRWIGAQCVLQFSVQAANKNSSYIKDITDSYISYIFGNSGFPDILAKSYKIVLSHTDTEDLYQQQAAELEKGKLILDIATRWNLLLVMIFCIL